MTESDSPVTERWSSARWGAAVLAVFVAQTLLVWLTSGPRETPAPSPGNGAPAGAVDAPRLRVQTEDAAERPAPLWTDPSLFLNAHPRGFSGRVWRDLRNPDYEATESQEPFQGLAGASGRLARALPAPELRVGAPLIGISAKPEPELSRPQAPALQAPRTSSLELTGDLASARLAQPPALPAWASADLLRPTVVEALVGRDGFVLSARVVAGSGHADADASALRLVRATRFLGVQVRNGEEWVFGECIFRWRTLAPGETS